MRKDTNLLENGKTKINNFMSNGLKLCIDNQNQNQNFKPNLISVKSLQGLNTKANSNFFKKVEKK